MRGRTNIVQRVGAIVNGEEQTFKVASGENISTGDFVSYETYSKMDIQFGEYVEANGCVKISEDTYIVLYYRDIGNYLYLIKFDGSRVQFIDYLRNYSVNCFCVTEDGDVFCSVSTAPYALRLSISNNKFVVENQALNGVDVFATYCLVKDNYFITLGEKSSNMYIAYYSLDSSKNLSYISNQNFASYDFSSYDSTTESDNFVEYNDKIYYTKGVKENSSDSTGKFIIYEINLDLINFESFKSFFANIFQINSIPTSYYGGDMINKAIIVGNYYILFGVDANHYDKTVAGYVIVNMETSGVSSFYNLTTLGFTFNPSGDYLTRFRVSNLINNNKFLIIVQNQYCILKVDEITGQVVKNSNILNQDSKVYEGSEYKHSLIVLSNDNNDELACLYYIMRGYTSSFLLSSNDDFTELYSYIDETIVRKYYNGSKSIGFAKHSANSGENIVIYTPKV